MPLQVRIMHQVLEEDSFLDSLVSFFALKYAGEHETCSVTVLWGFWQFTRLRYMLGFLSCKKNGMTPAFSYV